MTRYDTRCIQCWRMHAVVRRADGHCFCEHCRITFDPVDDGDVTYGDPARYAERKEEYQRRRQGRANSRS